MPDRFGSNESPYDALRAATLGSVSRADSNNDLLYLRLDATNDPITGALDIDTSSTTAFRVKSGANVYFDVDTVTPQTIVYQDFLHYDPTFNFGLNRTIFTDVNGVLHEWTKAIGGIGDQRSTISLIPKGVGLFGVGTSLELFVDDSTNRYLEMRSGTSGNKIISRATAPSTALPLEFAVGLTDNPATTMILEETNGLSVKGGTYTPIRANGTTHGQFILTANDIDQWSLYSQSDHILRFYKFDGTPGDVMTLTSAGALQTSRFISTISTGTAPLDVSSTTLVTNLNADLLDGLHASAFPNVGAASAQYQYIVTGAGPTYTPAWSSGLLNITAAKTLAVTGTLTLTPSSDGLTLTVPATGTAALLQAANIFSAAQTISYAGYPSLTIEGGGAGDFPLITLKHTVGPKQWNIENGREGSGILGFYRAGTRFFFTDQPAFGIGVNPAAGYAMHAAVSESTGILLENTSSGGYSTIEARVDMASPVRCGVFAQNVAGGEGGVATASNHPLRLKVNNTDALTIDTSWRVGIGTTAPEALLHVSVNPSTTNSIDEVLRIARNTTGTAANGLGARQLYTLESSTTADQSAAAIDVLWTDATHASRKARILGKLWDTAERQWLQVDTDGSSTDVLIDSLIYGSMYADDISQTETVGAANTEVKVTGGLSGGTCNGFTFQNSKELLCLVAGNYEVKWGMSVSSGTNNEDLSGGVVINTTTWQHSTEGSSNQPNSGHAVHIDGSGIITLAANDTVGLFVENESGGHNITIRHANLSLVRVGA